jgi:monoamine oxidase
MHTTVAIVGGGLAGLYAGSLLHDAGVDFRLVEARPRLGGRILSADESGDPSHDGFDLGPSWFWPHVQPQLASVVDALGLSTFPQHNEGDVIFERMSRETPCRYGPVRQESQSVRLVGGTGTLIAALEKRLPRAHIVTGAYARRMELGARGVAVTTVTAEGHEHTMVAEQVVAALPPRLLAHIALSPEVDPSTARRWRNTATWMAPHAKFFALYDPPFWREAGLSGTAQSFVGPLAEIHDATTASGKPALFGFLGVGADVRASIGEAALTHACVQQLSRLYGSDALHPRATILKDWAADPHTASAEDRTPLGHPEASSAAWVAGIWQERLSLAASETSPIEPGFMAGAVAAAQRAVLQVLHRLR